MISLKATWSSIKARELPLRYAQANGNYYIYCNSDTAEYCCVIGVGSSDAIDFDENYKAEATSLA